MKKRLSRSHALAALAAAAAAGVLAGCGGGGDEGGSAATGAAAAAATTAAATTTTTGATSVATPIKVGFLNQEKGAAAFPDFGAGARVAAKYVNEELGGVGGRPIELVECLTDGSPESSIDCANQLAEENVVAVLQGIDFSSDATLPILAEAGIPMVGHTAFGPEQSVSERAFFLGAALPAYGVAPLVVMRDELDASSAAYLGSDTPLIRSFVEGAIAPAAEKLGIDLTASFYPAASTNLSAAVTAALASRPDVVFTTGAEPECLGIVRAAKQLSFDGAVFAGSCSAFIPEAGAAAEGVYISSDLWAPESPDLAPADKREQIAAYREWMEAEAPDYVDGYAQFTFSSTVDLASILGTIDGEITPASVTQALRSTKDLPSFMGQDLTCDGKQWPGQPSACGNGILVYRIAGGKREPVGDGFIQAEDLVGG